MKANKRVETEALVVVAQELDAALANALELWLATTSDLESPRLADLMRVKRTAVREFLTHAGKRLEEIKAAEVQAWWRDMQERKLAANTIAARLSYVSSFFSWLLRYPALAAHMKENPFLQTRPKAPKPYQSDATKALSNDELQRLRAVIERHAASGEVQGQRDYAIFLFLMYSGMRRAEVLRLRGQDLEMDERGLIVGARVKGGKRVRRYVTHPSVWEALLQYLETSGRLEVLRHLGSAEVQARIAARAAASLAEAVASATSSGKSAEQEPKDTSYKSGKSGKSAQSTQALDESAPLWVRHDPGREAAGAEQALAEWSFARRMKTYAEEAGMTKFHLHQTRHTFARIVAETTGSMSQTQEALGHKHLATTRAYVERIGVLPDPHSEEIARRMKA